MPLDPRVLAAWKKLPKINWQTLMTLKKNFRKLHKQVIPSSTEGEMTTLEHLKDWGACCVVRGLYDVKEVKKPKVKEDNLSTGKSPYKSPNRTNETTDSWSDIEHTSRCQAQWDQG